MELILNGFEGGKSIIWGIGRGNSWKSRLFWAQMALALLVAISRPKKVRFPGPTPSTAPRMDLARLKTAVVYHGETAVARVSHVPAFPPTIDISSATGVSYVSGVSVAGVPGVAGVPALVWLPTMLLASLLLLVYALVPTFLQLLTLLSLTILLLLSSKFLCSHNETDIQ
jgi:hypothetical protein